MSELPNRVTEILSEAPPSLPSKPGLSSKNEPPTLLKRLVFIAMFLLLIAVMVAFTPQLATQIAYSWNLGVEQAKAKVARQFLAENPISGQRITLVAKAIAPCVVGIHTITTKPPEEYYAIRGRGGFNPLPGVGSGVIVDTQGYILTNYHVIEDAHLIRVQLSDGRTVEADVVGYDRPADLAVLRIDINDLEAIPWGDSRQVTVGEQVVAVGSPYGLQQTVTSGIISATERYNTTLTAQRTGRGGRRIPLEFLQTDAAINPGNSGGALVDMNGKLIGICTAIISAESGGNSGIGFAIPSFMAKHIYEEIVSHGKVQHGWIGVRLDDVNSFDAQQMNQKKPAGTIVRSFANNSPAKNAGLQNGDIILRWGETAIINSLHLTHLVTLSKPGTKETVEIFRKGEFLKLEITIGVRPMDL